MADRDTHPSPSRRPRLAQQGPTVADVAREAGVSPMTVSRVINNEPNVTAATRERVTIAVAALGYVPNLAARRLAGGQSCRVALLYSNPSAAYLSELLVGGLAEAAVRNVELTVEPCNGDADIWSLVARLVAHRIDAVLLPPPLCDNAALLTQLHDADLPVAQVATGLAAPCADAVTIDDEAAAHAMTTRMIALGHRRIGFIAGPSNQTASALRQAGYVRALVEAGIDADPSLLVAGNFSYRSGLAAAERLLDRRPRPTAIFASNDDMAAAAITVAHRRRLDVPQDLSVCGFDDTAIATTIWPELTTIRQPIADMARQAVHMLSCRVRDRSGAARTEGGPIRLAYELVARDSDGPPPASA